MGGIKNIITLKSRREIGKFRTSFINILNLNLINEMKHPTPSAG